jgi:hypothetical protein
MEGAKFMNFGKVASISLLSVLLNLISPIQVVEAEARQCAIVKTEAKKIFDGKYKSSDGALLELAKRTVKAYQLIITNKNCISKKDYTEMITGIRELKKSCVDAKKDAFVWGMMKEMCSAYTPLWKYIK